MSIEEQKNVSFKDVDHVTRAGNVFDSIDRRGESDRKVPRQARPIISRKDVEKSGPGRVGGALIPGVLANAEAFRSRAATAPVNSLKRRKERERVLANMIDNNNDESFDEGNGNAGNGETVKSNDKKQSKYRFAFKKNLAKENGEKNEGSSAKTVNRRIGKGREGTVTPSREMLAQSAPVDESDVQKLRTRSASASSNSERRRRTRRRRGRKSGTVDNEITDLSFEDALHHLQEMEQIENQEMYYREGQTWTEDGIGCEMQVVGGTTYFTPLANQNNQDSNEALENVEAPVYNGGEKYGGWNGSVGEGYQDQGFSTIKVESYEEFTPKSNRKVTQSAPMGGRTVKQWNIDDLRENLKMIWSETERKLTKDEVKLAQAEQLASEMVAAIEVVPEETPTPPTRADQPNISAIWNETAAKPIKNVKSIWGPTPADQASFNERSRESSPTWGTEQFGEKWGIGTDMTNLRLSEPIYFDPLKMASPPTLPTVNHHGMMVNHAAAGSSSDSWNEARSQAWDSQVIAK